MGAAARIEKEIPTISWPFFLLHGDADKLCDIRGSKIMFDKAPSPDKKIKVGRYLAKNISVHQKPKCCTWISSLSLKVKSLHLCFHMIFILN